MVYGTLVLAFASLVTAHVALLFGLAGQRPRWRAAVALLAPPLAPYWGLETGMRVRAGLWVLSLSVYVVCLVLALR